MDWEIVHHLKAGRQTPIVCQRCGTVITYPAERYHRIEQRAGKAYIFTDLCDRCFRAWQQDKKNHSAVAPTE